MEYFAGRFDKTSCLIWKIINTHTHVHSFHLSISSLLFFTLHLLQLQDSIYSFPEKSTRSSLTIRLTSLCGILYCRLSSHISRGQSLLLHPSDLASDVFLGYITYPQCSSLVTGCTIPPAGVLLLVSSCVAQVSLL